MTVKKGKGRNTQKSGWQGPRGPEEIFLGDIPEDESGAEIYATTTGIDRTDLVVSGVDLNNNKVSEPRD